MLLVFLIFTAKTCGSKFFSTPFWNTLNEGHLAGFPKWGRLVGVQTGHNGQKPHENYKIGIFGSKQWGHMGDRPVPPLGKPCLVIVS